MRSKIALSSVKNICAWEQSLFQLKVRNKYWTLGVTLHKNNTFGKCFEVIMLLFLFFFICHLVDSFITEFCVFFKGPRGLQGPTGSPGKAGKRVRKGKTCSCCHLVSGLLHNMTLELKIQKGDIYIIHLQYCCWSTLAKWSWKALRK